MSRCPSESRRRDTCTSTVRRKSSISLFFFFNDTATTEIYTLSLHDALPISRYGRCGQVGPGGPSGHRFDADSAADRKSTRLNSSHGYISYAVFCLKKKNTTNDTTTSHNTPNGN